MALFTPHRYDIILQSPEGQFVAVVEIKNVQDLSRDVATSIRRNSMTYSLLPQTPYFLLLSQDKGFLWKEAWREGPEAPPAYEFPMHTIVACYTKKASNERLYDIELEFLVLQWLTELAEGKRKTNEEPEKTLARAGFDEAIQEARVAIGDDA